MEWDENRASTTETERDRGRQRWAADLYPGPLVGRQRKVDTPGLTLPDSECRGGLGAAGPRPSDTQDRHPPPPSP